jgi:hypothetical protein
MIRVGAAFAALFCVSSLFALEPFSIRIPEFSAQWFPAGATVRVPSEKYKEIQVRLRMPEAKYLDSNAIKFWLDERSLMSLRETSGEGHIVTAKTRDSMGLFTHPEHRIKASTDGRNPYEGQWTISLWDKTYIEAVTTGKDGTPIAIRLDPPNHATLALPGKGGTVRLKGELTGAFDSKLTADGKSIIRIANRPGFRFDESVVISADAKEFVLRAEDGAGDITILVLKVFQESGQ